MPDPELSPLAVPAELVKKLRGEVGELPLEREERVRDTYGLGRREVGVLVALGEGEEGAEGEGEQGVGVRWFEEIVKGGEAREPKVVMNWCAFPSCLLFSLLFPHRTDAEGGVGRLIHTLLGVLTRNSCTLSTSPLSPSDLGALIDAVTSKRMNGTEAKAVLGEYVAASREGRGGKGGFAEVLRRELAARPAPSPSSSAPDAAAQDNDLTALIDSIISSHPLEVSKIRAGQTKVIQRLVGEAMKRSKGRADARRVAEEIGRRLGV